MKDNTTISVQKQVRLAPLTTIQLGGKAAYFFSCGTVDDIRSALTYAQKNGLRIHVLGGGSNTIFADEGFDGLVIQIALKGIEFHDKEGEALVIAQAGEEWDSFVIQCINHSLAGVECLSGIPGLIGATPMQNVGAYGQEVADTIEYVEALDTQTGEIIRFTNKKCAFEYRGSRFKYKDNGKYIITTVAYRLVKNGPATTRYPEVQKIIEEHIDLSKLAPGKEQLAAVREVVLSLRKKKSMVIDKNDPNSRSCGSFFVNPIISQNEFENIQKKSATKVPYFTHAPQGHLQRQVKLPAAWLIEQAGFPKGYRKGNVGISQNHTLALVNYGGTTQELLALAQDIRKKVQETFGIELTQEPVIVT